MKTFDNLAAMRSCLTDGACARMVEVLADMRDYIDGPIEHQSSTALFGAPAYLIERVEELGAVLSFDEADGQRISLANGASGAFDVAEWIDGGRFARFITIETADGEAQYLVPKYIAEKVGFVGESIELVDVDTR